MERYKNSLLQLHSLNENIHKYLTIFQVLITAIVGGIVTVFVNWKNLNINVETYFETLRAWECFDADRGKDLAVEVREYFIPDFSEWKSHYHFEEAFKRLIADLKASA